MSRRRFVVALALGLIMTLGGSLPAQAHAMRTAYLEVREHAPGLAVVRFRTTVEAKAWPRFPHHCRLEPLSDDEPAAIASENRLLRGGVASRLHCDRSLAGETIGIEGLGSDVSEAVIWVTLSEGTSGSAILTPSAANYRVPGQAGATVGLSRYLVAGIEHILRGADHLLFLLLLVLTLRRPRAVLWAESAFTLSHGLAFSAAALGWIHVAAQASEACVAASLLLLALDVERPNSRPVSTLHGAAMSLVFGCVHGLSFASGLAELGMPSRDVGRALLGFGAGVEIGQLVFLGVALTVFQLLSRRPSIRARAARTLGYAIGAVSSYWFIERTLRCVALTFSST